MSVAPGYRFRVVTPEQEAALRAARESGARVADLAAAYGISVRAAYRAIARAGRPSYEVVVADRRATFQVEDGTPVQVTPWVPA